MDDREQQRKIRHRLAVLHHAEEVTGHSSKRSHPAAVDPDGRWASTRATTLLAAAGQDLKAADSPVARHPPSRCVHRYVPAMSCRH